MGDTQYFEALYTKQKRKKRKRWQEGALKWAGKKLVLYDATDLDNTELAFQGTPLESLLLKTVPLSLEEEYDFEHFLVEVGEQISLSSSEQLSQTTVEKKPTTLQRKPLHPAKSTPSFSSSSPFPSPSLVHRPNSSSSSSTCGYLSSTKRKRDSYGDKRILSATKHERTVTAPLSTDDLLDIFSLSDQKENTPPQKDADLCDRQQKETAYETKSEEMQKDCNRQQKKTAYETKSEEMLRDEDLCDRQQKETAFETTSGKARGELGKPPVGLKPFRPPTRTAFIPPARTESEPTRGASVATTAETLSSGICEEESLRLRLTLQYGSEGMVRKAELQRPLENVDAQTVLEDYLSFVKMAIVEEIQLTIAEKMRGRANDTYFSDTKCTLYRKQNGASGSGGQKLSSNKMKGFRKRGFRGNKRNRKRFKGRPMESESSEEDEEETTGQENESKKQHSPTFFLNSSMLSRSNKMRQECSPGDLWFVSPRQFTSGPPKNVAIKDVWIFSALWHGATHDGSLQLEPLSGNFNPCAVSSSWGSKSKVTAQRGPNIDQELVMLRTFHRQLTLETPPVFRAILFPVNDPRGAAVNWTPSGTLRGFISDQVAVDRELNDLVTQLMLNEDQKRAMETIRSWVLGTAKDPVLLVHGPYGSGKTKLTCAAIMFLLRVLGDDVNDVRICVTAATNVAVDNVLKRLLDYGVRDVGRIGSVKRIDKDLLGHILLHNPRGLQAAVQEVVSDLQDKKEDPKARAALETIMKTPIQELEEQQADRGNTCKVVGVTCSSSSKSFVEELFKGKRSIVFLDEACQVVEPLSMLPILKTNCEFLVLVGDPHQLSPVTSGRAGKQVSYANLETPLFQRLCKLDSNSGVRRSPVFLRTQYRCHPKISDLSSRLFYNARVQNGIAAKDRLPLIAGLPSLAVVDVFHGREELKGGSFVNKRESVIILQIVVALLRHHVSPEDIGIIALYRAQATAIQRALQDVEYPGASHVTVATIDAFQGAERKVILVSCCRTQRPGKGGFVDCPFRLNVMLTRAQHHLLIVGNVEFLRDVSDRWRRIVECSNCNLSIEGLVEASLDAPPPPEYAHG